jgi:hypothetical protein
MEVGRRNQKTREGSKERGEQRRMIKREINYCFATGTWTPFCPDGICISVGDDLTKNVMCLGVLQCELQTKRAVSYFTLS